MSDKAGTGKNHNEYANDCFCDNCRQEGDPELIEWAVYKPHRPWFWRMVGDLGHWLINKAAAHTTYVRVEG